MIPEEDEIICPLVQGPCVKAYCKWFVNDGCVVFSLLRWQAHIYDSVTKK